VLGLGFVPAEDLVNSTKLIAKVGIAGNWGKLQSLGVAFRFVYEIVC